jgi:hypothetical protein
MPNREELKKALDYLRKKDPQNDALQKFDRQLRSYTTVSKKNTNASIKLYDEWNDEYNNSSSTENMRKFAVRGNDGGWESKKYQETIDDRWASDADLTHVQKMQKKLKKQFGIENYDKFVTYQEAQKMAKKNRELKEKDAKAQASKKNTPGIESDLKAAGKAALNFFNPFDNVKAEDAVKNFMNRKTSKQFDELERGSKRTVDSASFGLMSNLEKKQGKDPHYLSQRELGEGGGTDMITTGLGYLVPGVGAYKALNATKAGKALTQLGTKGVKQRLASEAAKGSITGAGMAGAEVAIREGLNPDDQDWKENAAWVGMGTAAGAIADPAMYGAGKAIGKGFEKAAGKAMKDLLPSNEQTAKTLAGELKTEVPEQSVIPEQQATPGQQLTPEQLAVKEATEQIDPPKLPNETEQAIKQSAVTEQALPDGVQAMRAETIPLRESSGTKQFKDMGFLESAVNKVVKAVGGKGYKKPITRQELLGSFRKNIGVTIRSGRLGKVDDSVQGYFKVDPEVIRSRQYGDIGVISHEIGHHLDKQFSLTNEAFDNELLKLGEVTSGKDYTPQQVREEGLAEYIRLFLTDPEKAIAAAPNFSQHFEQALPKKVKNGLLQSQADVDRWIEQGPELRLRGKVDRTGKDVETVGEKIDKVYSQFIDKFDRIKKVEKEITGKLNSAEKSIYKKARLSVGAPKKAEMVLQDLKDILKPIENYGYNMKDVGDYVTAVHALELENMGQKVANEAIEEASVLSESLKEIAEPDEVIKSVEAFQKKYDIDLTDEQIAAIVNGQELDLNEDQLYLIAQANRIESGMTLDEINKTMAKYDSPEMKGVQEQIVGYNNKLLEMLQEGQVLSKEAVESMREKYPNYVPFYRFFEDDITVGMAGNKGFTNLTNPVKRLQGSTRDVIDPLESIVKNTFAVVNAVEKNKVGLELSRLADVEGAGRFIERLDGAEQVRNEHIVTVFENGEKKQYQLDKDLYEAIQQLDEDRANKVIQFLSYPTSTLRAGATLTPEFMLRNPIRDQFQAFVVSNNGYMPLIDLPLGAWEVLKGKTFRKDGLYKQWAMNGGGYGNYISQDRNYLRETMKTLKKEGKLYQRGYKTITNPKELGGLIMRTLQAMSEFSEEATKLGEYRKAIKKGATEQEAAYQARDLMDFGRVGSDMRQWNRAVAFLNANLQGKDKIARAFKNNPIRTTTRALTGITLPAYGAYLAMETLANEKQRETYENTPKWMKDTFFLLPIPGTDELARIPKPFDLAPVFANPVEQIMDYYKGNDPGGWDEFLKRQATELLKIPHMLTGLTPIIENITNHSFFTGGPVVPRRDQDLLPQDQYGVSTSLTARTVGNLTADDGALSFLPGDGISPYKADNFIRGYGAGLGKYATSGLDKALEKMGAGQLPPQEAKKWSELPVVNAFTVDSTGGGQVMNDFYDALDVLRKGNNSSKRNEKEYEREGDYKLINKVSREISELRNEYRSIQSSYDMTPDEKRRQLDQLDRQMNELAREALIDIGEKQR